MNEQQRDIGINPDSVLIDLDYRQLLTGYHALIFSVENYLDPVIPQLHSPINDGRNLAEILVRHCGFPKNNVLLFSDSEVTWERLDEHLRQLITRLTHDDSLLIYFAGHGEADSDTRESYWLPHDANKNSRRTWYSHDRLYRKIAELKARHVAVVSDSCFSGRLLRSASEIGAMPNGKKWLTDALRRRSRMALTSGGDHPVSDEGPAGLSIFNSKLTKFIRTTNKKAFSLGQLAYSIQSEIPSQRVCYGPLPDEAHDNGDFVLFRMEENQFHWSKPKKSTANKLDVTNQPASDFGFSVTTEDVGRVSSTITSGRIQQGRYLNSQSTDVEKAAEELGQVSLAGENVTAATGSSDQTEKLQRNVAWLEFLQRNQKAVEIGLVIAWAVLSLIVAVWLGHFWFFAAIAPIALAGGLREILFFDSKVADEFEFFKCSILGGVLGFFVGLVFFIFHWISEAAFVWPTEFPELHSLPHALIMVEALGCVLFLFGPITAYLIHKESEFGETPFGCSAFLGFICWLLVFWSAVVGEFPDFLSCVYFEFGNWHWLLYMLGSFANGCLAFLIASLGVIGFREKLEELAQKFAGDSFDRK